MNENSKYQPIIGIWESRLEESFKRDIVDFAAKREQLTGDRVIFDNLVEKLTMSIEVSHCESYLVFQDDIPHFVEAFTNASKYSIWRSMHNHYIFGYNRVFLRNDYFQHYMFQEQPNILLIELENSTSHIFNLKTNKFVGKRADQQDEIYLLNRYNAQEETFEVALNLFPDKTSNLMGREVVLAPLVYTPYMILTYDSFKNVRDLAFDSDAAEAMALLDGTEVVYLLTFCEKFNCTVEIDTCKCYANIGKVLEMWHLQVIWHPFEFNKKAETDDWGIANPNGTGDGALGMVAKRKAEITIGGMYLWYVDYSYLDVSMYLGRNGITCLVPAPRRLASWFLALEPFQPTLWVAVMASLCLEILGLLFTRQFEKTLTSVKSSWFQSFKFGYVTTLRLFLSQSSNLNVRLTSVRVLLFACFINDIIITSIYGGGLASILTIPSLEEVADSLDGMVKFQLKWSANSAAWLFTIQNSDDPRMNIVRNNFIVYTTEEMRQLAVSENMGFALERLPFGYFAYDEILTEPALNRLKIMMDDIYYTYTVSYVSRLWPLLERYNDHIHMWHSSGFDKFWEWKIVSDYLNIKTQNRIGASMFPNFAELGPIPISISNVAGILVMWALGIVLSISVFIWEVLRVRLDKKKQLKKQ